MDRRGEQNEIINPALGGLDEQIRAARSAAVDPDLDLAGRAYQVGLARGLEGAIYVLTGWRVS